MICTHVVPFWIKILIPLLLGPCREGSATGSLPPTSPREPPMARERMRLDDSGGKVAFCSYGTPPIYGKRSSFNV